MTDVARLSADWTELEQWVWERIAAGEPADLNARDREHNSEFNDLDPWKEDGWAENRRLRVKFLQTILTQKVFADATPYGGVRIRGALVDDAPLNLDHARLQRQVWLGRSRILTDIKCRNLCVDGDMSLEKSFIAGSVELMSTNIGSNLDMDGSTFEGKVNLNSAKVGRAAFLRRGATCKAEVNLRGASIGANLEMDGAIFEGMVNLNAAKVGGSAFLRNGATFKAEVDLMGDIGANLEMDGSTFEGMVNLSGATVGESAFLRNGATFKADIDLGSASIGSNLEMDGSAFEGMVNLSAAKVAGSAFLCNGATFKAGVNLIGASIGSDLDFSAASLADLVNMTGCQVKGELRLGSSQHRPAHWEHAASLVLRNAHVSALQDRWRDSSNNSWPKELELEGFTFDRLGGLFGTGKEADMMARPSRCYVEWLGKDAGSSPQPYEHLAGLFRRAGEPGKANDLLYAAREQRRRLALSKVDSRGHRKDREVFEGVGLELLRLTIGYGLGNRYFRVLWWVGGLTFLGMFVLIAAGQHSPARLAFAILCQPRSVPAGHQA